MATLRSLAANSPGRRANWRALGLSKEDMLKPKIAVVNSSSELAICYAHLDGIAKQVKEEIRAAGAVPFEVRTVAPSDFITGAGKQGSYILAGRDIIANDIEVQVEAALLDGMICLTSCDKTPPGHLMAAARLNIPTILVIGGYQQAGQIDGEWVDVEDVWSGSVGERFGAKPKFPVEQMAEHAIMGPGVCAGMATANTMHCTVEALGMCLPGHAPVRANSPKMQANARAAARRIVEMVAEDLRPRQILTPAAFRNAVATVLAVSGSINAIKHLQATAIEAENGVDVFALWEEMSDVPVLSAVRPTGAVRIEQFEDAGGARAILKRLLPRIEGGALTCTGRTLAQNLVDYEVEVPDVIHPLDRPFSEGPSIAILKGSFADTAVVRLGIRDGSRPEEFEGPARVFESTAECMQAIEDGVVQPGDVVVAPQPGVERRPGDGRQRQRHPVRARCGGARRDDRLRHRRPAFGAVPQGPDRGRGFARGCDRRRDRQGARRRSHPHLGRQSQHRHRRTGRRTWPPRGAGSTRAGERLSQQFPRGGAADEHRRSAAAPRLLTRSARILGAAQYS